MGEPNEKREGLMDNSRMALDLIASTHEAVLATLEDSKPFNSAVSYFYAPQAGTGTGEKFGTMVMLISAMAKHTRNLKKNPDVSLLVIEPGESYVYERRRVSVQGTAVPAAVEKAQDYHDRYLKLFPQAKVLFSLPDFQFYEVRIAGLYYIGGFGKIESFK